MKNLGAKWLSEKKNKFHTLHMINILPMSVKVKICYNFPLICVFLTTAAAWNLEEDEDSGIASGSTDGVPFGYTSGGLYYSTDVHLQTLHTLVGIAKLVFI